MLRQTATSSCPTLAIRTLPPSNPAVDGAELARRVAMLELVLGC